MVNSGADLDLNGQLFTTANALTINGQVSSTVGAITNSSATAASYAGAVALGSASSVGGASGAITLSGVVSGNSLLTKVGTDSLTLSNATNTNNGGIALNAGTLVVGTTKALGAAGNLLTINGGTLDTVSASIAAANVPTVAIANSFTFGGTGNLNLGAAATTDAGNYTITLNGTSKTLTLGAVTNTSTAAQTTTVNGSGNTLAIAGYNLSNSGTAYADVINGSGNVNITGPVTDSSGAATGSSLAYSGTGTLTLGGTNTFTGGTTLNSGTLLLNNARALGTTGTFTINGGTIDQTGTAVTLTSNVPIVITNSFAYGGTDSLNFGTTGAVSSNGNYTITLGGTTKTLTMGAMTNTEGAAQTTTVSGAGNTLSIAGYNLSNSSTGYTDVINGTGNISIGGTVASSSTGASTNSGLTYGGSGTAAFTGGFNTGGSNLTLTFNGGTDSISGAFSGTAGTLVLAGSSAVAVGALTTTGNGLQINSTTGGIYSLNGANTFTGGVNLVNGQIIIGNAGSLGSGGTFTIGAGTTIDAISAGITNGNVNPIALNGGFTFLGTGTLNLGTGAVSDSGSYTIALNSATGKTLTLGGAMTNTSGAAQTTTVNGVGNTLSIAGYNLSNSATAYADVINGTGNVNITGPITDSSSTATGSSLTYSGSGSLTLSGTGTSTLSGGLSLNSGTLVVGGTRVFGAAGNLLTINGGTIDATASGIAAAAVPTVAITNNFTYGGTGNLSFGAAATTDNGNYTIALNGTGKTLTTGILTNTEGSAQTTTVNASGGSTLTLAGYNLSNGSTAYTDVINGSANVSITGVVADSSGSATGSGLTYSGSGTLTLGSANTFTGGLNVQSGTVQLSSVTSVGGGTVTIGGTGTSGTLDLNGEVEVIPTLATAGTAANQTVTNNSTTANATLSFANATTSNFGGVIKDGASKSTSVLVAGASTVVDLSGNNTYSGGAKISSGTLFVDSATALGTGTITLVGGVIDTNVSGGETLTANQVVSMSGFTFGGSNNLNLGSGTVLDGTTTTSITLASTNGSVLTMGTVINTKGAAQPFSVIGAGNTIVLGGYDLSNNATPEIVTFTGTGNVTVAGTIADSSSTATGSGVGDTSSGTITLAGVNTYTGSTSMTTTNSASLLTLTGSLTNSAVSVANTNGGTFSESGSGSINGSTGFTLTTGTVILGGSNTYTGATVVNGGTFTLNGANGSLALSSTPIALNGGTFNISNTSGNNTNRVSDSQAFALNEGTLVFNGSAATTSTETMGALNTSSAFSTVTVVGDNGGFGGAILTVASLGHTAGGATALVNGDGLGDVTDSGITSELLITTAPTLVGATANTGSINSGVYNTAIVPYLIGEADATGGAGVGTSSGVADTFLTYSASTGLRPLNPISEFSNWSGTVTAPANGTVNNVRIGANATYNPTSNFAINSLIIAGANKLTIQDGKTLTDNSGALLFTGAGTIAPSTTTGALAFGTNEAQITVEGATGTISAVVTGSGGLTLTNTTSTVSSTAGGLTLSGNGSTITGNTTFDGNGESTLTITNNITLGNNIIVAGGTANLAGTGTLNWGGNITVNAGSTLTATNTSTLNENIVGNGGPVTWTNNSANSFTLYGVLSGSASVINLVGPSAASGNFFLGTSNSSTFRGDWSVGTNQTFQDGNEGGLGNAANSIALADGSTLSLYAANIGAEALQPSRTITVTGNTTITKSSSLGGYAAINGNIVGTGVANINAGSSSATFLLAGNNTALASGVNMTSGATTSTDTLVFSSNAALGGSATPFTFAGGSRPFTLSVIGTQVADFNGHSLTFATATDSLTFDIQDPNNAFGLSTALSNTGGFIKSGAGSLDYTGADTAAATGSLSANGGIFKLDIAGGASVTNALALNIGGGTFDLIGSAGGTTQTLGALTVAAGGGKLVVDSNTSGTTTLNLGAITATTVGSTLNIVPQSEGGTSVITTTSTNTNGILGAGRIVYNGTDWASNTTNASGGAIGALSSYTTLTSAATTATGNYSMSSSVTPAGADTLNSLKVASPASGQSLALASHLMTANGILVTGTNAFTISGTAGSTELTAANGNGAYELVVQNYNSGGLTVSAVIGDNGSNATSLTTAGTGTTTLTGINTYSGTTYVNGGVLSVNADNNLGAVPVFSGTTAQTGFVTLSGGTLRVTNGFTTTREFILNGSGGTFDIANGQTLTLAPGGNHVGPIAGNGNFTLADSDGGNGTLAIIGASDTSIFAKEIFINGGILQIISGPNFDLGGFSSLNFGSATTEKLQLVNGSYTFAGLSSASSNAVIENSGTTTAGTLTVDNGANQTYAGVIRDNDGTVVGGKSLAFSKGGSGTLTLTNTNNTYTGATILNGGSLQLGVTNALPTATALTINGNDVTGGSVGTLDLNGLNQTVAQLSGGSSLNPAGGNGQSGIVTNNTSGASTSTLTVTGTSEFDGIIQNGTGSGAVALAKTGGSLILTGANTYTGGTTISGGGNVIVAANNSLPTAGAVVLGESTGNTSGVLQLGETGNVNLLASIAGTAVNGAANQTVTSLTTLGTGTSNAVVGGNAAVSTLTVNNSASDTYTGVLGGAGTFQNNLALTKSGGSTFTLAGVNTYTGATQVNSGRLSVTGSLASGTTVTVGGSTASGTPTLRGTGTVNGSVIVASAGGGVAGTVNPGTGSLPQGTLTVGNITFQTGSTFDVSMSGGATSLLNVSGSSAGALTIGSGSTSLVFTIGTSLTNTSYVLANVTGGGSVVGTFSNVTNLPSGYQLVYTANQIDLNQVVSSATNGQYTLTTTAASLNVHATVGSTLGTTTLTTVLANTGTTPQDTLNSSNIAAASGTGGSVSSATGNTTATNLADGSSTSPGATQAFTAGTSAGNVAITNNGTTVTNTTNSSTPVATNNGTTINVYSGLSVWNTNGGGSWSTTGTGSLGAGANWGANQGAPGVTAGFTGVDTATFGAVSGGTTPITVTLDGANPNLNAINFTTATRSYTLAQGTGTGTITMSGTTPSINVTAGSHTISAPINLGATTSLAASTGTQLTLSGQISGTGGLANTGAGQTFVMSDNGYTGGTTVSAGTLYANNTGGATYTPPTSTSRTVTATNSTGSATGTGAVTVNNGGTLAGSGTVATSGGVTVNAGGTLASGGVQSGTTAGAGLTINNTAVSILGSTSGSHTTANTANLTFDLGAGGSSSATQANPNTNSTYLSLAGSTSINFVGHTSITLVDLTNGGLAALRLNSPYLLISAASNAAYSGLVTVNTSGVESLDGNGYVLGVFVSGSAGSYVYDPINFQEFGSDGVTPLTSIGSGSNGAYYVSPELVLYNGDLEVVPEPGTWALMIGGLALLVVIQRRRNKVD